MSIDDGRFGARVVLRHQGLENFDAAGAASGGTSGRLVLDADGSVHGMAPGGGVRGSYQITESALRLSLGDRQIEFRREGDAFVAESDGRIWYALADLD